jgi:hypothetical protein
VEAVFPIGAHVARASGANERLELLTRYGHVTVVDLSSLRKHEVSQPVRASVFGSGCGAFGDGHWWIVEAGTGRVLSTHPAVNDVPAGAWIGVATGPARELVLASAEQSILVFDLARRQAVARFPARVSPTVRESRDECTPIAFGTDWIGVANPRTSALSVYAQSGTDLGARRLDRVFASGTSISTIGGAGRYLGVATDASVVTLEVRLDPSCAAGGAPAE